MSVIKQDARLMLEMGMGTDLHGGDYSKAAVRAVRDALQHSSLSFVRALGLDKNVLPIKVTVGVQQPDAVDVAAVAAVFPIGDVTVEVVAGGLNVPDGERDDTAVIASAAIEVFTP